MVQLCEVLGKNVRQVVDDYVDKNPQDEYRQVPLAFEEYRELAPPRHPHILVQLACPREEAAAWLMHVTTLDPL